VIFERNAEPSPDGQKLMAALLEVSNRSMPIFLKSLPAALTRRLIGDDSAAMLGVPAAGAFRLVTTMLRPFNAMVSPYVRTNALGGLATALTRRLYRWWIDQGHGDRPPWRFPSQWVEPARDRVGRRVTEVLNRSVVVPRPAKTVVSRVLRPS